LLIAFKSNALTIDNSIGTAGSSKQNIFETEGKKRGILQGDGMEDDDQSVVSIYSTDHGKVEHHSHSQAYTGLNTVGGENNTGNNNDKRQQQNTTAKVQPIHWTSCRLLSLRSDYMDVSICVMRGHNGTLDQVGAGEPERLNATGIEVYPKLGAISELGMFGHTHMLSEGAGRIHDGVTKSVRGTWVGRPTATVSTTNPIGGSVLHGTWLEINTVYRVKCHRPKGHAWHVVISLTKAYDGGTNDEDRGELDQIAIGLTALRDNPLMLSGQRMAQTAYVYKR